MTKVRQFEVPGSQARRAWLKSMSAMAAVSAMGTFASANSAHAAGAEKTAKPAAKRAGDAAQNGKENGKALFAYVGTYTPHGLGIHRFRVDRATGKLDALDPVQGIENPSALVIDPQQRFLFSTSEVKNYNGTNNGSVSSYAIEAGTGALHPISTVNSQGAGPVFLSLHPNGRYLLVANYNSGSVAVLPVGEDGTLHDAVSMQAPQAPAGAGHAAEGAPGSFAISDHDGPHAHTIVPSPDGRFAISTDLGVDRTYVWKFDENSGSLAPNEPAFVAASAGAGPRHVVFHPNGRWLYEVTEEASTLVAYGYDAQHGTLAQMQSVSTLPPGFQGTSFASEIILSHDARFIYVANRLHDTIAQFGIGANGQVHWIGEIHTGGDYPRVIRFDPSGRFLYALNQRSDHIAIFSADKSTGKLRFTGSYAAVGSPSDIAFASV